MQPSGFSIAAGDDQKSVSPRNNSSSSSSVVTLQPAPSFNSSSSSRSRTRGQSTPHQSQSSNGFSSPSNPKTVTPPTSRRKDSLEGVATSTRWSRSASVSKDTTTAQRPRRMSFGSPGAFTFGSPDREKTSTKRLQKSRPSIDATTSTAYAPRQVQFEAFSKPSELPPIVTLPGLETSLNNTISPLEASPSTAGLLSAAIRSTVPDYFAPWDSGPRESSHRRASSQSRPPPSASTAGTNGRYTRETAEEETNGKGHYRNQSGKSSGSARSSKQPSQKAMLSKALQKANTAVLLDNAQNFEGAVQAYSEACALLQQVMARSSGDEDRRKLEAIRNTYTSRITELKKIYPPIQDEGGKALPARPESGTFMTGGIQATDEEEEPAIIETATITRIVNDSSYVPEYQPGRSITAAQLPRRRESLLPSALESAQYKLRSPQELPARSYSKSPMRERSLEVNNLGLAPPMMETLYMPPPLSPRRPQSPMTYGSPNGGHERQQSSDSTVNSANLSRPSPPKGQGHTRAPSNESMSWLDTIDESGGSDDGSSVHSRSSSRGVQRKRIRAASGATEAEFDLALDEAVEAAYADGFEPANDRIPSQYDYDHDDELVANVRRRVELAKERVRAQERETAVQEALEKERRRRLLQENQPMQDNVEDDHEGNESEEEERMLEEMTRGYIMDDFEFGLQSKSALPRESDSSGFSGRTWNSSIGSNPTTAGTTLSTVSEAAMPKLPILPHQSLGPPPSHPPPAQALPPPPMAVTQPPVSMAQGVRSRRLSGQNAKQLKIETTVKMEPVSQPPTMPPPSIPGNAPKTAGLPQGRQPLALMTGRPPMPQSARQASFSGPSPSEIISPPTPNLAQTFTNDSSTNGEIPRSGSPTRAPSRSELTKNYSSTSLKNIKSRNLSVSYIDDASDRSPGTPHSQYSSRDALGRVPTVPTLPTPMAMAFKDKMNGIPTGGLYLFDSDIHSPDSPGTPNPIGENTPLPLEPCPTEFLLRPFWLMRALYQTIANPRGGYLSTKLFIPRDVWRVKGVKIKNVEDKIASCDYLTAALLKLARVDTYDADAVLEEMQALEGILEQVQITLAKKLGNEVGIQGSGGMFKDAPASADSENPGMNKPGNVSSKASSFSWRRLRSKNSAVALSSSYSNKITPTDGPKEGLTMSTLPMTTTAVTKTRFAKRDVSQVQFSGPNANYMGALTRLFDAAQAIDQIARQVEDPGLRHADKTQVGLELCTRHAAEFFGFYICRFVLTDVNLLLEKFIKRASEWVLV